MYKGVYECECVCVRLGVPACLCVCVCVSTVSTYIHVSVALLSLNNAVSVFLLVQLWSVVFVRVFICASTEVMKYLLFP